jgi:hypothetical protein
VESLLSPQSNPVKQNLVCSCGSVDLLIRAKGPHTGAWCNSCGRWIRWMPQNNPVDVMPFGKHKGEAISALPISYIDFLLTSDVRLSKSLRAQLEEEFEKRGGV